MPIKSISITNLGPFSSLAIDLPKVAIIQGGNGQGKTGLLECIQFVGERGKGASHDPDLIHGNAEWGEIVLTMDTGHELRARVTRESTTRGWRPPDGRRWIMDRSYIDQICTAAAYDPLRFLDLSPKEQAEQLLKLAPIHMDPAEVTAALAGVDAAPAIKALNGNQNPLECVDAIHNYLYERRKQLRSQAEDLEAHVAELGRTIPEIPPEGYKAALAKAHADKVTVEEAQRTAIAGVNATYQKTKSAAENLRQDAYGEAQKVYERKLKEIEVERLAAHTAADAVCAEAIEQAKRSGQARAEETRAHYAPSLDMLTAEIARLQLLAEQEQQAKGMADARDAAKTKATATREQWKVHDTAVSNLQALRLSLADRLPIKGVMVRDGRIVREQAGALVPLSKWNEADATIMAIKIGVMVGGKAGFVCIDHGERFDKKKRAAVLAACSKHAEEPGGIQFIICSVDPDGGKLRVEDGKREEALR